MRRIASVIVMAFLAPDMAFAFCSAPSMYEDAPEPPGQYTKPDVPYCLSGYSYTRTHTCDQWELDSYIDEINEYISKLQDYTREAESFANAAAGFADEAFEYARLRPTMLRAQSNDADR